MKLAGLTITIERTAPKAYALLALIPGAVLGVYAVLTRRLTRPARTLAAVLSVGIGVALYHALVQLVHQLGHALAARASGYPMTGIRYDYAFTYSTYPPDEPSLPAGIHIQRSLGGLAGTTLMLVLAVVLWLGLRRRSPWVARGLLTSVLLDSLLLWIGSVLSDGLFVVQRGWETSPAAARDD